MGKSSATAEDLLDYLWREAGCAFLSDLHFSDCLTRLQSVLQRLDAAQYPLQQWQEAIRYIAGTEQKFSYPETARQFLLQFGGKS